MLAFGALADPTRRQFVELLSRGERSAGEIADEFDQSQPAISQHLKALRDAGLVTMRAEAQRRIYALDPSGLARIDVWLEGVRKFWPAKLDALERELRKPSKRSKR